MEAIINNINTIIKFLAKRDMIALTKEELNQKYFMDQVDLLILMGNSIPYISLEAAKAYKNGIAKQLMIAGGIGHATEILRKAIKEKYPNIITKNKPEADIMMKLLELELGINKNEIIIENSSTNCGENAKFALEVLKNKHINPKTVILMQDPTMQLRMEGSFKREWKDENVSFISFAAFIPQLYNKNEQLAYVEANIWGLWEIERFISLVISEIPRLMDTSQGYGPRGKGFITHIDVPESVISAYEKLLIKYETLLRK